MQQQQELIEDEAEQEQKEEDARRAKREAEELEARTAEALLPDAELHPEAPQVVEADNARLTDEQLNELSDALMVLSSKSSVLKERKELRALMEENLEAEEVCLLSSFHYSKPHYLYRIPHRPLVLLPSAFVLC